MNIIEPSLDDLVQRSHPYRKLLEIVDFSELCKDLHELRNQYLGRTGYNLESGFAALVLQWMENLSDRELERFLRENLAGKFFCGFTLFATTPDHSYFSKLRKSIGTERLAKIFNLIGDMMRKKNLISDIFTFVDASQMVSKIALWNERDKAIKAGEEKLNNINIEKHSADKNARIGCKGKDKFWFGYKRHVASDMKHGLIKKVAATPANLPDSKGLNYICPRQGAVIADKGYCGKEADKIIRANGCHNNAIKKNNMKNKNKSLDVFLTSLRMPYENIFSKMDKKVRYRGIAKVQFQAFMQAIAFNFKRLITINAPPLFA